MTDLAKALPSLQAPFSPAAVKFKIQTNPKHDNGSALIVAFIDSRLVAERLNHVCPGDWERIYREPMGKAVVCRLTVCGSAREDVGYGDAAVPDMAVKSMYSDAFKRAAVGFGIGTSLYALPQMWVKARDLDSWPKGNGKGYGMSRDAENGLRRDYATWLNRKDVRDRFGAAIDHGDELRDLQGEIPQNFPTPPNLDVVMRLVRERKIKTAQLASMLDQAGVPAEADIKARTSGASVDQLHALHQMIEAATPVVAGSPS